jgi:hypothetical protein
MRHVASLLVWAIVCALPVSAQSLGDMARKEEARRKAAAPGKVYTNDNLRPSPVSAPAAAAVPAPDTAAGTPSVAGDPAPPGAPAPPVPDSVKKDEAYWRTRIQAEVQGLERAKLMLDALQSRVNGLQTDFVNRDDPAARAVIGAERARALGELDRTKTEIQQRTKALAAIREEARRSGAPAAWYR